MNCPYCNAELEYHDYFGKLDNSMSGISHDGEIYKCPSEGTCESEQFNYFFYTFRDGDLKKGYPC